MRIAEVHEGQSNVRFVVELSDGARVETVLYRGDTVCVSCQVGCAVRCPFCASGANGLGRPLRSDEIVGQIELVRPFAPALRGVTFSGVGEPLHNADAVKSALDCCVVQRLRATLTTSGGRGDRLNDVLVRWPHQGLTLSVHAGTAETRARLVPHAATLDELDSVLRASLPALGTRRRKRFALAYLLVARENDSDSELDAFGAFAARHEATVHLYAYNAVDSSSCAPVTRGAYERAYDRLCARGLRVRMSSRARLEGNGGCGTLVAKRGSLPVVL